MPTTCQFCGGDLEERSITYTTEYESRVVVISNVPATVCTQCGEILFAPDVVEKLQKIVWGETEGAKPVSVDSYDFPEVA
jgi:YgiT-type zinc finger domain-containing protein